MNIRILIPFLFLFNNLSAGVAPDFTVTSSDGKTHHLYADYINKNKMVVLQVFFTTCPACVNYVNPFRDLFNYTQQQYPEKVAFFLLSDKLLDTNTRVAAYLKARGLGMYGVGSDGGSLKALEPYTGSTYGDYIGTPTFIIIQPKTGEVLFDIRGSDPQNTLDRIGEEIERTFPSVVQCAAKTTQGKGLKNATVRFKQGEGFVDVKTAADGSFKTPFLTYGKPMAAQIEKNDDALNGVTTLDMLIIAKHILEIDTIKKPEFKVAGDVNRSGAVTTLDITQIRRVLLGISDTFPQCKSWEFTPSQLSFEVDKACQEAVALKMGDVNGSADPSGTFGFTAAEDRNARDWVLWAEDRVLRAGEQAEVLLRADQSLRLSALQGVFVFNPALVETVSLETDALNDWDDSCYRVRDQNGDAAFSWYDVNGTDCAADEDVVLRLRLRAKSTIRLSEVLQMGEDGLAPRAYSSDYETYKIALRWLAPSPQATAVVLTPNPADSRVDILLPEAVSGEAFIRVSDVNGRLSLSRKEVITAATRRIPLDLSGLPGGIYFVRVNSQPAGKLMKL